MLLRKVRPLLLILVSAVLGIGLTLKQEPQLNHFVVRVLVDCALTVLQLPFSIAGFLFYWRAVSAAPPPAPAA